MADNAMQNENFAGFPLENYHGFWYVEGTLSAGIIQILQQFDPRPTDIFLASLPKSGTTWLKALSFATINRNVHRPTDPNHPLLSANPHDCVPLLLDGKFLEGLASEPEALLSPRLIATHLPYQLLPETVKNPHCKIVYICRDPKDTLVSTWHFIQQISTFSDKNTTGTKTFPFDEAFEKFCRGVSPCGPIWDHCLGYWNESLKRPSKVLFLKYEDMKRDEVGNLKLLAEFLGCPFLAEEEKEGVAEEIVRLCSFEKLRGLEVNKTGDHSMKIGSVKNSSFFRKGKVGDWKNHFSDEMARMMDEIIEEKLRGSGLNLHGVDGGDQ